MNIVHVEYFFGITLVILFFKKREDTEQKSLQFAFHMKQPKQKQQMYF